MSKTLSLNTNEWQSLLLANFQGGFNWVQNHAAVAPTEEDTRSLLAHIDRMHDLVVAWHASGAGAAQTQPDVAEQSPPPVPPPAAEAVAPAPRKGGWPKGKKRNVRQEAA